MNNATKPSASAFANAARFWEFRRLIYNAILTIVVLLWVALTWPHFRPALTLGSLEAFIVLGLAANSVTPRPTSPISSYNRSSRPAIIAASAGRFSSLAHSSPCSSRTTGSGTKCIRTPTSPRPQSSGEFQLCRRPSPAT